MFWQRFYRPSFFIFCFSFLGLLDVKSVYAQPNPLVKQKMHHMQKKAPSSSIRIQKTCSISQKNSICSHKTKSPAIHFGPGPNQKSFIHFGPGPNGVAQPRLNFKSKSAAKRRIISYIMPQQ